MLHEKYKTLFEEYGLVTKLRLAHFYGQLDHESGLVPKSENLNYSAKGLLATFPKYFTSKTDALSFERQPERIANRVYANRMGNGNSLSGEGWKYRGRGFIQLTGKENYFRVANDTGIDCLKNPDILLQEPNAVIAALWFWRVNGLNKLADQDSIKAITKVINGGYNGLEDRIVKVNKWKQLLK